jgi:cell division transport system permease protein
MANPIQEAIAAIKRTPLLTGLSALMVGLALFVVGLFGLATHNLQQALEDIEERVEVVAYLREGTHSEQIDQAILALGDLPGVETVGFVSKDSARARAISPGFLPEITEVSEELESNPFPASLEVRFAPGSRTSELVLPVAEAAGGYPFVEDVQFGQGWVENLFLLRRVGAVTAMILGGAFAVVAILIIATAIRIAIFARRDEIQIMRLVGAKNGYVHRPFILEGGVTGALGGVLAFILTLGTYRILKAVEFLSDLAWLPAIWVLCGMVAGGLLGILAASLAVRRYLKEV